MGRFAPPHFSGIAGDGRQEIGRKAPVAGDCALRAPIPVTRGARVAIRMGDRACSGVASGILFRRRGTCGGAAVSMGMQAPRAPGRSSGQRLDRDLALRADLDRQFESFQGRHADQRRHRIHLIHEDRTRGCDLRIM